MKGRTSIQPNELYANNNNSKRFPQAELISPNLVCECVPALQIKYIIQKKYCNLLGPKYYSRAKGPRARPKMLGMHHLV
jgi:hypothetical protein